MSNALKISTQGGVQTLTLSRPDVRNAFNDEVIAELKNAFRAVAQDSSCSLRGAGRRGARLFAPVPI
jgi:methylglutaconyl-CoA hydratase